MEEKDEKEKEVKVLYTGKEFRLVEKEDGSFRTEKMCECGAAWVRGEILDKDLLEGSLLYEIACDLSKRRLRKMGGEMRK